MTMIHPTSIRNSIVDLVTSKINLGTTNSYGNLILKNSSNVVLVTLVMSNPAFGVSSLGIATANVIASALAVASGIITKYVMVDRDENTVATGTVTAVGGGGDLEATTTTTSVILGESVSISTLTYNAPA